MEWSTISACPSLMCFFNWGNVEGTNSSKILCLMLVYVLLYVNVCQDWFCGFSGICGLITCVKSKRVNKRQIEVCFSPDVILCGWLGSNYQLTNCWTEPAAAVSSRLSYTTNITIITSTVTITTITIIIAQQQHCDLRTTHCTTSASEMSWVAVVVRESMLS